MCKDIQGGGSIYTKQEATLLFVAVPETMSKGINIRSKKFAQRQKQKDIEYLNETSRYHKYINKLWFWSKIDILM